MEFLNPAYLAALGGAVVPFLLHLIFRRKTPKVDFSTIRFLKEIDVRMARKRRLTEILVLLLRAGALAFLALALARPLWKPPGAVPGARGRVALAIVLDASASMTSTLRGSVRFDRARNGALSLLDTLRPGDRAALFLPGSNVPFPASLTDRLDELRITLRNVEPGFGTFPLSTAVGLASEILEHSTEAHKEIALISDLQKNSFGKDPAPPGDLPRLFVAEAGDDAGNAFVADARPLDAPLFVEFPAEIAVTVGVAGPDAATVPVSLFIDGKKVGECECTVKPGEKQTLSFTYAFRKAGLHRAEARIAPDALPVDDAWAFTLRVHDRIPVLVVNGDPNPAAYRDEVFYITAALGLEAASGTTAPTFFRPEVVAESDLTAGKLTGYRVLILANVLSLGKEIVARVRSFVNGGGGLIVFPGDRSRPGALAGSLDGPGEPVLPAVIEAMEGDPGGGTSPWTWVRVEEDHEIFGPFRGASRLDFAGARFFRIARMKPLGRAKILAEHENGIPALVEGSFGKGSVLLFSSTADMDWNTFPVRTAFLPLLYQCAFVLSGLESRIEPTYPVGASVPLPPGADRILGPGQKNGETEYAVTPGDHGERIAGALPRPGFYAVRKEMGPGAPPVEVAVLAVNVDRAESGTDRLDPSDVVSWWGEERAEAAEAPEDLGRLAVQYRRGSELTGLFLALGALCFVLESFFANRRREASQRREGDESMSS